MPGNEFLSFAADAAADVMPWTDYANPAFTTRLLGFSTGTALSTELNRVWRQSSMIGSMIGQFASDRTGRDMLDDGTPAGMATLQLNFDDAIKIVALEAVGTGYLPLGGGTLTGPLYIDANALGINAPAGQWASTVFTRTTNAGAQLLAGTPANEWRWGVHLADNTPETGGNAGSNFSINRYDDTGNYIDTPIAISRATGVVNFAHPPTFAGGPLPYLPLSGGIVTGNVGLGGTGINYYPFGANTHAFSWDASISAVNAIVDGTWVGSLATRAWVNANHSGAYLPLAGGTITGNLGVNGHQWGNSASFASSVSFGNAADFVNYIDQNLRVRSWASNWYELWDGASGNRVWGTPGPAYMLLTAGTDLYIAGSFRTSNGRIMSAHASVSPSIAVWNQSAGLAMGMWCDPTALIFGGMDGSGNPTSGMAALVNNSTFWVAGGISTPGYMNAGTSIGCGSINVSGNAGVNGSLLIDGGAWAEHFIARNRVHANQMVSSGTHMDVAFDLAVHRDVYITNISYAYKHLSSGGTTPLRAFDSLTAICAVDEFDAASLQHALPDAVTMAPSDEGADLVEYLDPVALIAHLFRAVKQLNDKLEGH